MEAVCVDCVELVHYKVKWRIVVNRVMDIRLPQKEKDPDQLSSSQKHNKESAPCSQ